MSKDTQPLSDGDAVEQRNRRVGGIALVTIGLLILVAQFVDRGELGLLLLPALGLIFLAWGILTHEAGLLIPGGVLIGVGLGVFLMVRAPMGAAETAEPGIFLIAFGAGWALITLISAIAATETVWWTLIPGAILALIGGALYVGGPALALLELVGRFWPVGLVAAGVYLLYQQFRTD